MNNKIILLSVLILLCAIQACNGQLIDLIFYSIFAVVNAIFCLVINISLFIVSFAVFSFHFIAEVTFSILEEADECLYSAVVRNNETLSALDNISSSFDFTVDDCSALVSPVAKLIGHAAARSMRTCVTDLSFTFQSSAIALIGFSYDDAPASSKKYDGFDYDPPGRSCAPRPSKSRRDTTASIKCQVDTFNYTSQLHIDALRRAAKAFKKINENLESSCSINETEIEEIISDWISLQVAYNAYADSTVEDGTTLLAYANATVGVNVSIAFNRSEDLIESIANFTSCIVDAACQNLTKEITESSIWSNFTSLVDYHARVHRRLSNITAFGGLSAYIHAAADYVLQLNNATNNYNEIVEGYKSMVIMNFYTATSNIVNEFFMFLNKTESSSFSLSAILGATISAAENNKTECVVEETDTLNATASAGASLVISQNSTYPGCGFYVELYAGAFANFSAAYQSCASAADDEQIFEYMFAANLTANATIAFTGYLDGITQCYIDACTGNSASYSYDDTGFNCINDPSFIITTTTWYWFFIPVISHSISAKGQSFVDCINNVASNVIDASNDMDAITAAIELNLQAKVSVSLDEFASCLATEVFAAAGAFASIEAGYNDCTASCGAS